MIITGETEILPTPTQSPSDRKKYRLLKLQNGLKVLLVKHPEVEKTEKSATAMKDKTSALALCVDVGSFDDPFEVQGLSHFLEHMVRQNKFVKSLDRRQYLDVNKYFCSPRFSWDRTSFQRKMISINSLRAEMEWTTL